MGLLTKETIKTVDLREDYKILVGSLPVDEFASGVVTRFKDGRRTESYFLIHKLLKECYNIPGIPNGTKALLICSRDVRFDPLKQLDDSWDNKKISEKCAVMAKEQQHKAEAGKGSGMTNISLALLSAGSVILILACAIVGVLKYYGG